MNPLFYFSLLALLFSCPSSVWAGVGCSPESDWKVAAAAACLQEKDVGCAKLKLDPVLANEPGCGSALFVKGWILQYFDGKVAEGEAMQERAMKIEPKLANFWERRGHAIESGLTTQTFSNFDIQFQGAQNRDKAWDAVRYLNEMHADLSTLFGMAPPRRIPVIVFATGDFVEAWRAPFVGGFFDRRDGKIRIRVDEVPGGAMEFQHRARHEMTHAFLYQLYPKDIPSWASEGIPEYCARQGVSQGFWRDDRLEKIRKQRKGYRWLTLDEIERLIAEKKGTVLDMHLAYLQSEALTIWISKDRGDSWIPKIIHYLRQNGGSFDAAYQTLFGVTPEKEMERLRHYWE